MTSVPQLSPLGRSPVQKLNSVNKITEQTDFIDFFRTFLPNTAKQTFFSVAQGTFSKLSHILGYKANIGKLK